MLLVVRDPLGDGSATYFFSIMHIRNRELEEQELKNCYKGGATVCAFNMGDQTTPIMHSSHCSETDGYNRKFGMLNCVEKFLNQIARSSLKVSIVAYATMNEELHVETLAVDRETHPYDSAETYVRLRDLSTQRSRGNWVHYPRAPRSDLRDGL